MRVQETPAEPEAAPEVSGEKYFEVQTSLKGMFNQEAGADKPFSLLDMLGRPGDQEAEKPKLQQGATLMMRSGAFGVRLSGIWGD